MALLKRPKWAAEVAIDEPLRSNLPIWSLGRIVSADTTLDRKHDLGPLNQMAAWLRQRSVGCWRFVKRERVTGRVSVCYRAFKFEQIADARHFAQAWANALITMRAASLERQVKDFMSPRGRRGTEWVDHVLAWLLDYLPTQVRRRSLLRLRGLPVRRQIDELVAPVSN